MSTYSTPKVMGPLAGMFSAEALLILSPGNSYMTGQTIAIDGGVTAW